MKYLLIIILLTQCAIQINSKSVILTAISDKELTCIGSRKVAPIINYKVENL